MAELTLGQVLTLCDALENDNYELVRRISQQDDLLDQLEKENDTISQSAILDAVSSRGKMGMDIYGSEYLLKEDPLRFSLLAIRITIYIEQIGDSIAKIADIFAKEIFPIKVFSKDDLLNHSLSRLATVVGMVVESLIEEKEQFYGSIREVCDEIQQYCEKLSQSFIKNEEWNKQQIFNMSIMISNIDHISGLSINIAEELVRLTTGEDIRHLREEKVTAFT